MELQSGFDNAWSNGVGEYVLSDRPSFNPNTVFANQNWTRHGAATLNRDPGPSAIHAGASSPAGAPAEAGVPRMIAALRRTFGA